MLGMDRAMGDKAMNRTMGDGPLSVLVSSFSIIRRPIPLLNGSTNARSISHSLVHRSYNGLSPCVSHMARFIAYHQVHLPSPALSPIARSIVHRPFYRSSTDLSAIARSIGHRPVYRPSPIARPLFRPAVCGGGEILLCLNAFLVNILTTAPLHSEPSLPFSLSFF